MSDVFNIDAIKEKITETDIKNILAEYDALPYSENDSVIIFPTICHNINAKEASPKLYYYKNSKKFFCFTECNQSYDIFGLVQKIEETRKNKLNFFEVVEKIKDKINYQEGFFEYNNVTKYKTNQNYYKRKNNKIEVPRYDNNIINFFTFYLPYEWAQEGITYQQLIKYNIRYYKSENEMIIPHYDINKNLVGIRIRVFNDEDILKGKYRPLKLENKIYSHPLSQFCYGLWENKNNIQITGKAIIVEGEKSVLKGEQLEYNNLVACCGSNISKIQIQQLIQNGAKEIIIAFDKEYKDKKDKHNEIYYNKLHEICERYKLYCNMSFIFDFWDKIEEKDSPIDKGIDTFNFLVERRIKLYE